MTALTQSPVRVGRPETPARTVQLSSVAPERVPEPTHTRLGVAATLATHPAPPGRGAGAHDLHGDCREVTAWLEAYVLVMDPPYGTNFTAENPKGGYGRRQNEAGNSGFTIANDSDTGVRDEALGRHAIGVELEERYCEIAAKRLSQGVLAFEGAS